MGEIPQGHLIAWHATSTDEPVEYHASYHDPLAQEPWVYGFLGRDLIRLKHFLANYGATFEHAVAMAEEALAEGLGPGPRIRERF